MDPVQGGRRLLLQGAGRRLPEGRRLPPGERREQILAAAHRMLETSPLDEVSVEAVAAAVGVSPALLFHYFGSQREFRRAVIEAAARELLSQMSPDPGLSAAEQLHAALDMFTAAIARSPGLYLAVVRYNTELSSVHWDIRGVLSDWLSAGLSGAGVTLTPALTVTLAGWLAFTEEAIVTWITQPGMSREDLVLLCERACHQLLATAAQAYWPAIEQALTTGTAHPATS